MSSISHTEGKTSPLPSPMISIIMPVYNGKKWMTMAIESVLWQRESSWELIIVDDFSTDSSLSIAHKYARLDSRIRVLSNCNTKGVSGTRNTGLDAAQGTYISFIDCDDILLPHMYSTLLAKNTDNSPMIHGLIISYDILHFRSFKVPPTPEQEQTHFSPNSCVPRSIVLHLLKKDFLTEHNLRFDENLHCSEDMLFLFEAYALVDAVPCALEHIYIYIRNNKPINYSAQYSLSIASAMLHMIETLTPRHMQERLLPHMEYFFIPRWLHVLHELPRFPQKIQDDILQKSIHIFSTSSLDLKPSLKPVFQEHTDEFLQLCHKKDPQQLVSFLCKNNYITQGAMYLATDRQFSSASASFWYALPRKLRALTYDALSRQILTHILKLHARAMLRTLGIMFTR